MIIDLTHEDITKKITPHEYYRVKYEYISKYENNTKDVIYSDVNIKNPITQDNILRDAVKERNFGLCEFLIIHGANVNARVPYGKYKSPLCWSLNSPLETDKISVLLMENGASLKYSLVQNINILYENKFKNKNMYEFLVKKCIEFDIDHSICDEDGETLLCHASRTGRLDFCQTLIGRGANPFILIEGKTVADFAGSREVYFFLVSYMPPVSPGGISDVSSEHEMRFFN